MNPTQTLIDKAAKNCSSYAELARKIGTSHAALSEMKHGKREMSPETAALLADIANEDAREAVIRAVMDRNKTGPKAQQIREILGKALAAGVAAMLLFSYSEGPIHTIVNAAPELTGIYIVSIWLAFAALRLMISRSVPIARFRVRVSQWRSSVKGKGFADVLTRSAFTSFRSAAASVRPLDSRPPLLCMCSLRRWPPRDPLGESITYRS